MKYICCKNVIALLLTLFCFCLEFGTTIDTITSAQFINDSGSIVSSGSIFKLGFFSPQNSTNRYLGIWYNQISLLTVVWVANRNKPLLDSSGILTISDDGNLLVLNGKKEILWSSNVSSSATNSSAQLLDTGNLVLQDVATRQIVWESFQQPTDSHLPEMKLSTNTKTKVKVLLTSWKSPSDPSIGNFSMGIDSPMAPEAVTWNGIHPYWRSGPWNRQIFIGIPGMKNPSYHDGVTIVDEDDGTFYMTYSCPNTALLTYYSLSSQGKIEEKYWDNENEIWVSTWLHPRNECDVYGKCGAFGSCDQQNSPICSCLRGYVPYNIEEWKRGNWTSGCVRSKPLQCERVKSGREKGNKDGFLKLNMMKVPAFIELSPALKDQCRNVCLSNCSCIAYGYYSGIGCVSWSGNLIDIQKFSSGGVDLYIRLAHSELDNERHRRVIITITVLLGTVTIAICTYILWGWITKERACDEKSDETSMLNRINQIKLQDLPLFKFEKLLPATNNFHPANKLGQGGFGPVYLGKLQDGQEIAVKRLSRASGQGLEEFMNEVVVISKLQHRNLVRLLGCCIDGEEKMLVYEYMPNKSLDAFLFVHSNQPKYTLNWSKRFNIIEGISRGLLYLHRDSRLRIIHRDLKPSNILLDEEMNPKISDFGTARIFGSNENQANTKRVVGTYGYMSPEYAMEGRFSEKSDVFSFGVLLLEIVSGRRNTSFYHDETLTLLGFAWKLWNEDNIKTLIDPTTYNESFLTEILRCIHVGLLCVQEFAKDRPSMSTVLSMLNSDTLDLPSPKQPAFTKFDPDAESSHSSQKISSINNATVTIIEGR